MRCDSSTASRLCRLETFLQSYLHKVDAKSHPSPLCPLCNTHTHDTHDLFYCTHIYTTLSPLDLWSDPARVTALLARWTEKLAGGPQAGTSDSPISKGYCCLPSETYGRNGVTPIFITFHRIASSTTGGWSRWNILMCFLHIILSIFGP